MRVRLYQLSALISILDFYIIYNCSIESADGPWRPVLHTSLEDPRQQTDPLPLQAFSFPALAGRFVKLEVLSYYGKGGGLQFFNIISKASEWCVR